MIYGKSKEPVQSRHSAAAQSGNAKAESPLDGMAARRRLPIPYRLQIFSGFPLAPRRPRIVGSGVFAAGSPSGEAAIASANFRRHRLVAGLAAVAATDAVAADRCFGNLRECLGDAAFGMAQSDVLVAVLAVVFATFAASLLSRRFWIGELAFIAALAGGLVSNAAGMILLTVGSLGGVLVIGWIADRFGIRGELSAADMRAIERNVDTTIRDDLGVDSGSARRYEPPPGSRR